MPNKRYNGTKHAIPTVKRKRRKAAKPHEATSNKQKKGRR
jgi:hypothetical protein